MRGKPRAGARRRWVAAGAIAFVFVLATMVPAPIVARSSSVLTFGMVADATIAASSPTTNFGSAGSLTVDGSPSTHTLLRFQVTGVGSAAVSSAVIRLYVKNASPVGGRFFRVAGDSWNEGSVTWQTAPATQGNPVAALGGVTKGTWAHVDVSSLVVGDGVYSLRVTSDASNGAAYASREAPAALRPQIVVTTQSTSDATPPSVGISSPAEGSTLSGISTVTADASDDVGVASVEFLIDGVTRWSDDTAAYSFDWDTRSASNGSHVLVARALDAAGNVGTSAPVTVTVDNPPDPTSFSFAAAGDHGANQRTDASLAALDGSGSSFYLALGDLDYGDFPSDQAWCDYVKARLPTLGPAFPFEVVVGNHEEDGGPDGHILNYAACLPDRLGATIGPSSSYGVEYFVDYPPSDPLIRVIMIAADHTVNGVKYEYTAGSPRSAWLASTIDDARASQIPWVAVGTHKPCLSASGGCSMGEDLMNLLVAKRVDLVLTGHHHNYQRSKQLRLEPSTCPAIPATGFDSDCVQDDGADGVYAKGAGPVFVIAGSFGAGTSSIDPGDPEAPYFARTNGTTFGFVSYEVTRERIDAAFVATTGTFSDAFSIRADAGPPDAGPPSVPTGLTGTAANGTTVDLTWVGSTDDVGVDRYDVFRDAAPLATVTTTMYSDATVAPGSIHTYAVRAVDAAGNASALSDPVTVTTPSAASTLVLESIADAYVSEANPTANYGAASKFAVDASPRENALLTFAVSGVGSAPIVSVRLRLYDTNGSSVGGLFFPVADTSWDERTVTWTTAPAGGPTPVASLGAVTAGTWYEVDLTSFITGDGVYSLRVASTSTNGADYTSREGAAGFRPQLVIAMGAP